MTGLASPIQTNINKYPGTGLRRKTLIFSKKKAARRPLKVRQAASSSPSAALGIPAIKTGHAPVEADERRGVALRA